MSKRIEDYAMIGDCETAALVALDGSIDWLCLPSFDGRACFAALLGDAEHGTFRIRPVDAHARASRRYLEESTVLETQFETADGVASLIDFMPLRDEDPTLVRIVCGRRGKVRLRVDVAIRFDYGGLAPYLRLDGREVTAVGGPDALRLVGPVPFVKDDERGVSATIEVGPGDREAFVLTYFPSHRTPRADPVDARSALVDTLSFWRDWIRGRAPAGSGPEEALVRRSLVTLKALTYRPTGAIVAAPTTSLPERIGGERNWDYRYCWLRDATFTTYALLEAGFTSEAKAWRDWLVRAVAGAPARVQIMYGLSGERRLPELELPWLPGYEDSRPVRIGNDAHTQGQIDIYGEVMDSLHVCREAGIDADAAAWELQRGMLELVEKSWDEPDRGIWEVRGRERRFVHSEVMAWVAFDRAIAAVERRGLDGPVDRWRELRARIHHDVCTSGFSPELGSFVQYRDAKWPDASLLMIPLVGFLPIDDARVQGTIAAVERMLVQDGLVTRYPSRREIDGLPPGEGNFLACSFWLVDNYVLQGRLDEARTLFHRLCALSNDVGLLAEEYDPKAQRLLGNFPQAFSHIALVNTARNLSRAPGPAEERGRRQRVASDK